MVVLLVGLGNTWWCYYWLGYREHMMVVLLVGLGNT